MHGRESEGYWERQKKKESNHSSKKLTIIIIVHAYITISIAACID